ncbi:HIRAN domain-containing protein [Dysgonomonas sp. Marseille-P4677]|uniref:HIRAN domain-containing protein n=1 Tax=Dysgonomonas sp. Marseille-P4677 TaxID=2364790 RepID=UPI001911D779|nr:HIRAN domain-containing protein [Dysgonomonas sp. Marseille-P4677]MBK5720195.1 HIRAN domain-containing protein [Dysgonomonas sp. Marseille-P4677]
MKNQFYATFYIAGFTYWNGLEAIESIRVGTKLLLEAEPTNGFDPNAVKIMYDNIMLGYIPREENEEISKFLQLGHNNLFHVFINRINLEAHPEKQISVVVRIIDKNTAVKDN